MTSEGSPGRGRRGGGAKWRAPCSPAAALAASAEDRPTRYYLLRVERGGRAPRSAALYS